MQKAGGTQPQGAGRATECNGVRLVARYRARAGAALRHRRQANQPQRSRRSAGTRAAGTHHQCSDSAGYCPHQRARQPHADPHNAVHGQVSPIGEFTECANHLAACQLRGQQQILLALAARQHRAHSTHGHGGGPGRNASLSLRSSAMLAWNRVEPLATSRRNRNAPTTASPTNSAAAIPSPASRCVSHSTTVTNRRRTPHRSRHQCRQYGPQQQRRDTVLFFLNLDRQQLEPDATECDQRCREPAHRPGDTAACLRHSGLPPQPRHGARAQRRPISTPIARPTAAAAPTACHDGCARNRR